MMQSSVVGVGPFHCAPSKLHPQSHVSAPGVHDSTDCSVLLCASGFGAAASSTQPTNANANVHPTTSFLMDMIFMRGTVHAAIAPSPARGSARSAADRYCTAAACCTEY